MRKAAFSNRPNKISIRLPLGDDMQSLYGQISRPVLILWGREDTWIPIEKGEVLHDMIPDSLFHVIPDAGHLVIEEQPDQLIEKIRPFLQNEPITTR